MGEKESRTLVVRRVHEEARDIRAFDVLPEGASDCHEMPFTPGQVALLEVGDAGRAYFAIASAPEDDELEFLVKLSNDPAGRALYQMRSGDSVRLVEIAGHGFEGEDHDHDEEHDAEPADAHTAGDPDAAHRPPDTDF